MNSKEWKGSGGARNERKGETGGLHFDYSDWGCHIAMNI